MNKKPSPPKPQRNAPCSCGSGKKYKKCHLLIEWEEQRLADIAFKERVEQRYKERQAQLEAYNDNLSLPSFPSHGSSINPWLLATLSLLASHGSSKRRFL